MLGIFEIAFLLLFIGGCVYAFSHHRGRADQRDRDSYPSRHPGDEFWKAVTVAATALALVGITILLLFVGFFSLSETHLERNQEATLTHTMPATAVAVSPTPAVTPPPPVRPVEVTDIHTEASSPIAAAAPESHESVHDNHGHHNDVAAHAAGHQETTPAHVVSYDMSLTWVAVMVVGGGLLLLVWAASLKSSYVLVPLLLIGLLLGGSLVTYQRVRVSNDIAQEQARIAQMRALEARQLAEQQAEQLRQRELEHRLPTYLELQAEEEQNHNPAPHDAGAEPEDPTRQQAVPTKTPGKTDSLLSEGIESSDVQLPAEPTAVVERTYDSRTIRSSHIRELPDWVTAEGDELGPSQTVGRLESELSTSVEEAEAELFSQLTPRLKRQIVALYPAMSDWEPARHVLREAGVIRRSCEAQFPLSVSGVTETVYRVYWDVALTPETIGRLHARWKPQAVNERLAHIAAGLMAVMLIFASGAFVLRRQLAHAA